MAYLIENLFILICLSSNIRCHVDQVVQIRLTFFLTCSLSFLQNMTNERNNVMKNFLFLCITLIVLGFLLGPIILMFILPCLVDPIINDDDDNLSYESDIKEQKSKIDSDETASFIDDVDDDNLVEQETASF